MIAVGERAPDAHFLDAAGNLVRLSDHWSLRPTVFLFLRHFG
jgi:hypothetical protein